MNVKINKEQNKELLKLNSKKYMFGSVLHGIDTKNSDEDYIKVIDDSFYDKFNTIGKYLPNIHSWQYDDTVNNIQTVWVTETQFYRNLFSGDGNMIADVVILSGEFKDILFLCRTYKIIKGYLGVAKRDLKLHGNVEKKRFHAYRSMYMAETLMVGAIPSVSEIRELRKGELPDRDTLFETQRKLRTSLNDMLNNNQIDMYPNFCEQEDDELVKIMLSSNNIKEFKY